MTGKENSLPCAADMLIPHGPPMLLVSRLITKADDAVENSESIIEAVTPQDGPFVENDHLLQEYYIEVMAQAIAASDGYPVEEGKKPATGLLTGIDEFTWHENARLGERITIHVRKTFEFGTAFIFAGFIEGESGKIASGQLKIWKVEE
jgi:predicted hotdog family 3-hydroxylacyl-ACP dehydratase